RAGRESITRTRGGRRGPRPGGLCMHRRYAIGHVIHAWDEVRSKGEGGTMYGRVGRERWVGAAWGTLFTTILAVLIVVGSRNLQHLDAGLVGDTFAVPFGTFAITYRYALWLQRPTTRRY